MPYAYLVFLTELIFTHMRSITWAKPHMREAPHVYFLMPIVLCLSPISYFLRNLYSHIREASFPFVTRYKVTVVTDSNSNLSLHIYTYFRISSLVFPYAYLVILISDFVSRKLLRYFSKSNFVSSNLRSGTRYSVNS